jgi:LasA protease
MPLQKPFAGIAPILTATAAARMNAGQIPEQKSGMGIPVDPSAYIIQSGDTLHALAVRFQTTADEIRKENPQLVADGDLTVLPPGNPLSIRQAKDANWNTPEMILPNSLFIYGPSQADFDVKTYLSTTNGWLKNYIDKSGGNAVSGAQIVEGTAENYSISPRLLLAILEFQLQAITSPQIPSSFSLGNTEETRKTMGKQLSWAANILNNGYYGWREGTQVVFSNSDNVQIIPNPSENAASVALQYYFSRFRVGEDYQYAISSNGVSATYQQLFGVINWPIENKVILLPENLHQPELKLPIQPNLKWAYTGGPHSGWGVGYPYAAIDFAPPSVAPGCDPSPYWAVAAADGVIARSGGGSVVLDLDGDGNPHTGWVILYLHISPGDASSEGKTVKTGDLIGHPSCVGGSSSGRNLHIARLFNGEWIPAGGGIPMVLDGWTVSNGEKEYKGTLQKEGKNLISSSLGEWFSQIVVGTP